MFNKKSVRFVYNNFFRILRQQISLLRYANNIDLNSNLIPTTSCQRRFFLLDQHIGSSSIFTIKLLLSYKGKFDIPCYTRAVQEIINNNPIFRTTFAYKDGVLCQEISENLTFNLVCHDLIQIKDLIERKNYIENLAKENFDPEKLPLFKIHYIKLDEEHFQILTNFHHIIWDGWSQYKFYKETAHLYKTYKNHREVNYPFKNLPYSKYALMEIKINPKRKKQILEFYTKHLSNHCEINLPFVNQSKISHKSKVILVPISNHVISNIKQYCLINKVTFNEFTLTVFMLLLHKYSCSDTTSTLIPRFSRFHPTVQSAYGPMLNALPLVLNIKPNQNFKYYLNEVKRQIKELCNYDDLPIDQIIEDINRSNKKPINNFQFLFNYLSPEWTKPVDFDGFQYLKEELVIPELEYLITMYISGDKKANAMGITFAYQSEKIDKEMAHSFLNSFLEFTKNLLKNDLTPISSLSIDTARNHKTIQHLSDKIPLNSAFETSFLVDFLKKINDHLNKSAIITDKKTFSYDDLLKHIFAIDKYIEENTSKAISSTIAITGEKNLYFYSAIIACLINRKTILLIDNSSSNQYQNDILKQSKAEVVLNTSKVNLAHINSNIGCADLQEFPIKDYNNIENLIAKACMIEPSDKAYICFTSGTTGTPKGILGSHAGLTHFINWQRDEFNITSEDKCAQLTNQTFDVIYRETFTALSSYASLVLPPSKDWLLNIDFFEWIKRNEITYFHTVPSIFKALLQDSNTDKQIILDELRYIFFAGEALSSYILIEWKSRIYSNTQMINLYGPSETSLAKSFYKIPNEPTTGVQPIGKPIDDVRIYILDENLHPCLPGQLGEIAIQPPFKPIGYINQNISGMIENPFTKSGFLYQTGDLGYIDHRGIIHIKGRKDHQIKINGIRVELQYIEYCIQQHPNVRNAAIVPIKEGDLYTKIYAFVSLNKSENNDIQEFLMTKLPAHMIPHHIEVLNELPRTSSGKINRQILSTMTISQTEIVPDEDQSLTDTESKIIDILSDFTSSKIISPKQKIHSFGINSLSMVEFVLKVRSIFEIKFGINELRKCSNISDIANCIDQFAETYTTERDTIDKKTVKELKEAIPDVRINNPSTQSKVHKNILLTGLTGFLGGYLLREIASTFPDSTIYCIIRSENNKHLLQRFHHATDSFKKEIDLSKVIPINADIGKECFGMDSTDYNTLCHEIDAIFHCAAQVDFLQSLSELSQSNIQGTRNIIQFAGSAKAKSISYISTAGIVPLCKETQRELIYEAPLTNLKEDVEIIGGYAQSKWISEALILEAARQGLSTSIHRIGRIGGDSVTGFWPKHDFIYCFLDTTIQIGALPDINAKVDLLPVDTVARMVTTIEKNDQFNQKIYHLVNPNVLSMKDLSHTLKDAGYNLTVIPYNDWHGKLVDSLSSSKMLSLAPFIDLLPSDPSLMPRLMYDRHFDVSNVNSALNGSHLKFPDIDSQLLKRYLNYVPNER